MSSSPYETYSPVSGPQQPQPYEPYDPHSAETVAYGMSMPGPVPGPVSGPVTVPLPYEDTYRPAYEPPPTLPQQAVGGRAQDRRAARRRKGSERPDAIRRLLPQALVVAFLAGGTTAFVAEDKAIELSVDGKPRTLHTFADDVTELLADEGVAVGAHDVVAPAPGTALASGDEVRVHYGRPVRITLDGERRELWTTAQTVDEALRQLGVRAEGAYLSLARSQKIGRQGLTIDVRTERTVTIMADGRARTIRTNVATVGEAVAEAGITLRGEDAISVAAASFPRDGQTVTVLRVTGTKEVREEPIPYDVRRTQDMSLFKGTEVVDQAGRPGLRRVTFAVRTVNGVKGKPRRVRTEVVRQPRAQLVRVGAKPLPTSVQGRTVWTGVPWRPASPGVARTRWTRPGRTGACTSSTRRPGRAWGVRGAHRTRRRVNRRSARRSCM